MCRDFGRHADSPADHAGHGKGSQVQPGAKNESAPTPVRVMGRSSNSPPPKSAHHQPTIRCVPWEWLRWATVEKGWRSGWKVAAWRQRPNLWQPNLALCETFFGHAFAPNLASLGASRPVSGRRSDASLL